jgi:Raf kinase inhibitor-like YbhB/YbcL family protein
MRHLVQMRLVLCAAALAASAMLPPSAPGAPKLALTSTAFPAGGLIPARFTCDGANAIVPLRWAGAPVGTTSFALSVDDPDAGSGTFLHRIAWGIPATAKGLAGRAPVEGANGAGRVGWTGPCPPSGTHRYVFRLYALRSKLPLKAGADRTAFEAALKSRVLAVAKLIGRYSRG